MTTVFKLRRGTTTQHSTFTGAAGEATIDTTKNTVVVHDGVTAGGLPLAKSSDTAPAATKLATARTIATTGDVTSSQSFDGTANTTSAATLAVSGVTAGSYTLASVTVDAKGRVTAASSGSAAGVTSVTGTAPISSSGGTTPAISIPAATSVANGYMTSVYAAKVDGIAAGATANTGTVTSATAVAGTGISVTGVTTSPSATHTITNTGVTSVTAGTGISVSASTGGVTITNTASGGVTSAVAGNGVAVSGATGAVTFSASCPTFNTVGSYCYVQIGTGGANFNIVSGSNYAAGNGVQGVQSFNSGSYGSTTVNNLSGTWKWMAAPYSGGDGSYYLAIACRVA